MRLSRLLAALALAVLACGASAGDAPERWAIHAGKVLPMSGPPIDDGVVLVAEGKIEAVGPASQVAVPEGYRLLDVGSRWLMPGMIEVHSHSGVRGGLNDMVAQVNPGMLIGDGVDPEDRVMDMCLAAGITTIQTIPGSGTNHGGFGVAFKTAGDTKEERILRRISIMKITQAYNPERRGGDIGATRMGMAWILREHLDRMRAYAEEWAAYERGERTTEPERDPALEPARLAFEHQIPLLIHTYETWGILMSLRQLHDEYGLVCIATHGGFGSWFAADSVARDRGYAINVGPNVKDLGRGGDAVFRGEVQAFAEGGVTDLTVNTDSFGLGQVQLADKAAIAAWLGYDAWGALRMVTINAARAMLLDDRIGSIEPGKDADLVVKASSLVDPSTPVEMVFVNGRLAWQFDAEVVAP